MSQQGEIIEKVIHRSRVSITQLSRRLKVERRTMYSWFNKEKHPADIIARVSTALDYDFSNELPEYASGGRITPSNDTRKAGADLAHLNR
jgi:predicted transcriptional regulator